MPGGGGGGGGGGMPGGMGGMPGGMPGMGGGDDGDGGEGGQKELGDHVPPNGGAMPDMSAMMGNGRQRTSSVAEDAAADLYNPDLVRLTMYVDGVGAELSGDIKILLHKSWAPLGVEHLEKLVRAQVYDGVKFIRVVPDFIVQFGIPASPIVTRRWSDAIADDPPTPGVENRRGTVVFATAGKSSRTTQLFVNVINNERTLDTKDYTPVGEVVQGMDILDKIYKYYGERPDQDRLRVEGDDYLKQNFPQMSLIRYARIDKGPEAPILLPTKDDSRTDDGAATTTPEESIKKWAAKEVGKEHNSQLVAIKLLSTPSANINDKEKKKTTKEKEKEKEKSISKLRRDEALKRDRNLRKRRPNQASKGHDSILFFSGICMSSLLFFVYSRCRGDKKNRRGKNKKRRNI